MVASFPGGATEGPGEFSGTLETLTLVNILETPYPGYLQAGMSGNMEYLRDRTRMAEFGVFSCGRVLVRKGRLARGASVN